MISIQNYVRPNDLEEAYKLNQKRSARIIGGMMWVRLSRRKIGTVIDLSDLLSDQIVETEDSFEFGAMASLRSLETHEAFNCYTDGAAKESVKHIVGIQFRNGATVGGSIYGRFGFSDVLTFFLALDSYVELYKGGILPLKEFVNRKHDNDILLKVIVKKTPLKVAYLSQRNQKTDFPVLAVAGSVWEDGKVLVSVGARPAKAALMECESISSAEAMGDMAADYFTFGSNMRASATYRKMICKVLVKRVMTACMSQAKES